MNHHFPEGANDAGNYACTLSVDAQASQQRGDLDRASLPSHDDAKSVSGLLGTEVRVVGELPDRRLQR